MLFSAGWCFLFLATFYWIIDVKEMRGWAFPLIVVGMNSIAMYCRAHSIDGFLRDSGLAVREIRPSNLLGYWRLLRCINEKPASNLC